MEKEFVDFRSTIQHSWENFLSQLPAILLAILVFIAGIFAIKLFSKVVTKFIDEKSKDSIVTDFLVNIISFILTIFLAIVCLGILGYGNITDKILAGTALTTFIVGFALKDIGENFLAGILMAFRRPFRIGDLIEVQGMRGRVKKMSLRETNIKTLDGKDVFIPNSIILKNPLENFTYNQLLRSEFFINVDYSEDLEKVMKDILHIINSFEEVEKNPHASVYVQEIDGEKIKLRGAYWFKTTDVNAPGNSLKSEILFKVIHYIKKQDIQIEENSPNPDDERKTVKE